MDESGNAVHWRHGDIFGYSIVPQGVVYVRWRNHSDLWLSRDDQAAMEGNAREESAANVALSLLDMRLRRIIAGADLAAAYGNAGSLVLHET